LLHHSSSSNWWYWCWLKLSWLFNLHCWHSCMANSLLWGLCLLPWCCLCPIHQGSCGYRSHLIWRCQLRPTRRYICLCSSDRHQTISDPAQRIFNLFCRIVLLIYPYQYFVRIQRKIGIFLQIPHVRNRMDCGLFNLLWSDAFLGNDSEIRWSYLTICDQLYYMTLPRSNRSGRYRR